MITQTLAIFHDAYRELNAKKMFWIVLVLSALVVLVFAAVGVNNGQLTFFGWRTPVPIVMDPAEFYRVMFTYLGIEVWLTLIATILALISTASIFPDFISGGSIDLYLSKPVSRLRLFLTKYAAGLLFAALQVFVFSLASFIVIGVRGGAWEPRLFLAVPLVVIFFSYLFCVCALVGVLTRSTVAAILLTALAWFLMWGVGTAEVVLLTVRTAAERQAKQVAPELRVMEGQIASIERMTPEQQADRAEQLKILRDRRDELRNDADSSAVRNIGIAHDILYGVKTVLPKTSDTTDLLGRWLLSEKTKSGDFGAEAGEGPEDASVVVTPTTTETTDTAAAPSTQPDHRRRRREEQARFQEDARQVTETLNTRPVSWVIGTSLGFEAVVLALAGWIFCRRDY
jgi:ABC-type transport system involved in multi-copper enzyme maturation permease subunit